MLNGYFYFRAAVSACFYAWLSCLHCQNLAAYLIFFSDKLNDDVSLKYIGIGLLVAATSLMLEQLELDCRLGRVEATIRKHRHTFVFYCIVRRCNIYRVR